MMTIALFCVLANAFVIKETTLFGLNVTCTDAYAVGSLLTLNLLQQYHGKKSALKMVYLSFFTLAAFALLAFFQLQYSPSSADRAHSAYATILTHSPRIMGASLLTFFVVQRFDIAFFALLNRTFRSWPSFALIALSLIASQVIDTLIFSFLGLYGIVQSIGDVILISLLVKGAAIAIMAPLSSLSRFFIKKENRYAN